MIKLTAIFIFSIFLVFNCFALEISHEEAIILEDFFRVMLTDSEGGFVIFEKKPVCINGFHIEDYFTGENERHRMSVYLREGASKWKKLFKNNQNIIIHIYNNEDSLAKNCIHVLFINKKLFLNVVESNLSLFQYVLGPDVTPIGLLNQLIDSNQSFHSVLKNDKVLIGILLGFGTQNSLYVSRIEKIEEALLSAEQPPFRSQLSKLGDMSSEYKDLFLLSDPSLCKKHTNEEPSFGYQTLKDETQLLSKKIDISSEKLAQQSPNFLFGRLIEDKETGDLINDLESTQEKIRSLVLSKNFLDDVLHMVFCDEKLVVKNKISPKLLLDNLESKRLPFVVAANIWTIVVDENECYKKAFIQGMFDAEQGVKPQFDPLREICHYEKTKSLIKAKENIRIANEYFEKLDKDENFVKVRPFQLYYKEVKQGNGPSLGQQTNITVHYTVKTPNDKILADTLLRGQPVQVSLMDTIPGFALGLRGMKIDEIREILIHPSMAYGIYTTLEKGIYLKVYVQLVEIGKEKDINDLSQLEVVDYAKEISANIDADYTEQAKKVGYVTGYQVWQHYKKETSYNFSQILQWLKQFESGEDVDISSVNDQDLINRLHWNIYHMD